MKKPLRLQLAGYMFRKEFGKQHSNRKLIPFEKAASIGIIYDSTDEKDFELVKKYVREIRETHHKEVLALGYYDQKELPPMRFSKLGLDFFTRKDLNWHFKPVAAVVKNFVKKDFDILIDLHNGNSILFRYIVAGSNAKFKIGRYDWKATPFYDFMLSVPENTSLKQLMEQLTHYLNSLRND
jgi:hypothetical protein